MDGPSSKLGARFRRALETEEARRLREQETERRSREEGREAREKLFRELVVLAKEIGLEVQTSDSGITLRYGPRHLHFGRDGDGERVKLAYEGAAPEELILFRQPELGNRWILVRRRAPREVRLPLFDQGLEDLLVRILGLPPPGE